jgi:hypothetical protein
MTKNFNYKVKNFPLEYSGDEKDDTVTDLLNSLGDSGWELVSVIQNPERKTHGLFYFKKKV